MNKDYLNLLRTLALDGPALPPQLLLSSAGRYSTYYVPLEHINVEARVVICGITPGLHQAKLALRTAQNALNRGQTEAQALSLAKNTASFAGPMRKNLSAMLDHIGLQDWLQLPSCADLFGPRQDLVHYTSALCNPVFDNGRNFAGGRAMVQNPYLWNQIDGRLSRDIGRLPENALFLPLGGGVDAVFQRLLTRGVLTPERVLFGLPHASGANAERIAYFCGRKEREALSRQTNGAAIDTNRLALRQAVQRLIAARESDHTTFDAQDARIG